MVVHGRKYGTKHKTKCGKWNGRLPREDTEVAHHQIDKITCDECKKKHILGKC